MGAGGADLRGLRLGGRRQGGGLGGGWGRVVPARPCPALNLPVLQVKLGEGDLTPIGSDNLEQLSPEIC